MEENQNQQNSFNNYGKMMVNTLRMPLWRQLINSFCGARKYPQFLQLPGGSVVLYFFFLVFIVTIFSVVVPNVGYTIGVGGLTHYITETIPDFELKNGKLAVDGTMEYESGSVKLYVNTEETEYTKEDIDENAYVQILVSSSNLLLYSNGMVNSYSFSDFSGVSWDKKQLLQSVPLLYVLMVLYWVISYLGKILYILSTVLLLAVVGMFSNSMYQFGMSFKQLFILALYATTIISILESINTALALVSSTIAGMVGMIWTAFVFFAALAICGSLNRAGKGVN